MVMGIKIVMIFSHYKIYANPQGTFEKNMGYNLSNLRSWIRTIGNTDHMSSSRVQWVLDSREFNPHYATFLPGSMTYIKGLLTTIVPWLGLTRTLFLWGGVGIGGVPLDSHETLLSKSFDYSRCGSHRIHRIGILNLLITPYKSTQLIRHGVLSRPRPKPQGLSNFQFTEYASHLKKTYWAPFKTHKRIQAWHSIESWLVKAGILVMAY